MIRTAGGVIGAQLVTAADGSAFAGTVTAYITGDGGTQAIATTNSGVCTAEGNGYYSIALTSSETDYALIAVTFVGTGAIPATIQILTDGAGLAPTRGVPAVGAVAALDLITDAFSELNVFMAGEAIPNGDAQAGLRSLNGLLGSWAQQHLTIPSTARLVFDLVAGQGSIANPYTIGSGGDFDTPRPANPNAIKGAAVYVTASDCEQPLDVLTGADWQALDTKTLSGTLAEMLFYQPTFTSGLGQIYLWPQPDTAVNQLVLYLDSALSTFADLTTAYQLPPGYRDALMYLLALRLARPYGRPVDADLKAQGIAALSLIKRGNVQVENAENYFGFDAGAQYDIYSDTTWRR